MKARPQFILALLFILMLYALAGCSTLAGPTCADEYSAPELVKMCQVVKQMEQRAEWQRMHDKHQRDLERHQREVQRIHERASQHGAGGCVPNHATGGCL